MASSKEVERKRLGAERAPSEDADRHLYRGEFAPNSWCVRGSDGFQVLQIDTGRFDFTLPASIVYPEDAG